MKKITKLVTPFALIVAFMLFSPHEAKAWRLFGKERTSEYAGSYGGCAVIVYTYDVYFMGIRIKTDQPGREIVGDCVPSTEI
jgi:hypothetical protein